jgi:electron transport complex protein RnfG
MVRTLGGIGILCSLLIVTTYQLTLPRINQNKQKQLERAVLSALPGASQQKTLAFDPEQGFVAATKTNENLTRVFAGLNDQGELIGFAIQAQGSGFQDQIKIIYGYAPISETIVGMMVLESKETPGLGDKIEKDAHFLDNFKALDVRVGEDKKSLVNPITLVKPGQKERPWEMDAITGATISSDAICRILGQSSATWMPRLVTHQDQIKELIHE